ncbi:MAG TPA: hypothetical protein DEF51_06680 [Myxococcales bacterium]|nr:hypothetical protein [Myxococcales bacterium]
MRIALTALLLLSACDAASPEAAPEPTSAPEADEGPPDAAPIESSWVEERVEDSRARMESSDAGRVLWSAIEAHGGLGAWLSKGTIAFEFDYRPLDDPNKRRHSFNEVDLWRARAFQREVDGDARFGFDGSQAWIVPSLDAFPSSPRFWATTPYYFVGIPFVLADPGARYERLEDAALDGVAHQVVRVTYEEGTGDSPDDYYVIYVHPETHRVSAIRYVVAYPAYFPEGGHTPEKLMRYEDLREVDGLWLAHGLDTYRWDPETQTAGELVTDIVVADYRLGQTFPASRFAPPEGAVIQEDVE